jgi:hypothetical protein
VTPTRQIESIPVLRPQLPSSPAPAARTEFRRVPEVTDAENSAIGFVTALSTVVVSGFAMNRA